MAKQTAHVPYGYEPPAKRTRGTLIYYDTFEHVGDEDLEQAAARASSRAFDLLTLYPIHEETWRRMAKSPIEPYYRREKRLRSWAAEREGGYGAEVAVDGWEGKRKKYTPIDAALRHLTETLPAPHMLYLSPETANLFASFDSFEEWIGRIRLLLTETPASVHPRLTQYRERWEAARESD